MKYFNYQNTPSIEVKLTVYRGKTKVKEDFSQASLFVFLVSAHDKIPVSVTLVDGVITFNTPTTLDMGVYGVKAIWTKELGYSGQPAINAPYGMEIHADKTSRADVENLFAIVSDSLGTTTEGTIETSVEVATYGYDGLDAYEMAVMEGATKLTKKEWLESRSLTAVLQTEGKNEDASMSQKAVTESLEKLRSVLGAGYHAKGKVSTLPEKADVGDIYCLSSNMHSYVCIGKENKYRTLLTWKTVDNTSLNVMVKGYLDALEVGVAATLPCSTTEMPYFTPKSLFTGTDYTFGIFPCDASGNVTNTTPVYLDNDTFKWSSMPNESKIFEGKVTSEKHVGDAIYQDYGELQTIDYTPKAEDTEFTPSSDSMFTTEDNAQAALNTLGKTTPSVEQNLLIAANINAQIANNNFNNLKLRYDRLVEVMQMLIERVMYDDPKGFKDMSELISNLHFDELVNIGRVTSGGSLATDTSVVGYGKVGSAKVGKI